MPCLGAELNAIGTEAVPSQRAEVVNAASNPRFAPGLSMRFVNTGAAHTALRECRTAGTVWPIHMSILMNGLLSTRGR